MSDKSNASPITRLEDGEGDKRRCVLVFAGDERVTLNEPRHAVALARALGFGDDLAEFDAGDAVGFAYGVLEGAIDAGVAVNRDELLRRLYQVELAANVARRLRADSEDGSGDDARG